MEKEELEKLLEPILAERGFELVDFEFSRQGKRLLLRFFIDRLEGGITVDELAEVNQEFGSLLDLEARLNEPYILEISSPGLDRRLRRLKDFQKYLNRTLVVESTEKINGRRHFHGRLVGADTAGITLVIDSESVFIPHPKIKRANLEYIFE
jgi:ribosome maturation factor RimP